MSWVDALSEEDRAHLRKAKHPAWAAPMLATLTDEPFSDPDWIYERKLDGERLLAFKNDSDVRLLSRNRKSNRERYPEIEAGIARFASTDFVLDGEVVAFEGNVTSFSKLQPRMQARDREAALASEVRVYYYVFDVLHLDAHDVTQLPQRVRKTILRDAFSFEDPIRYTPHRNGDGEQYLEEACGKGWEGLIAKDAAATYQHSRSRNWLKFKCTNQQELVVAGFTDPKGSRIGFGALLLGVYDGDDLRYAGKVGTGFDDDTLRRLHGKLSQLERKTSPFATDDVPSHGVHWVTPRLVAEVGFTEWTDDGKLRHPRYLALRDDKAAEDVVRESG